MGEERSEEEKVNRLTVNTPKMHTSIHTLI